MIHSPQPRKVGRLVPGGRCNHLARLDLRNLLDCLKMAVAERRMIKG